MERNVNRKKWYFLPYGVTDKAIVLCTVYCVLYFQYYVLKDTGI